MSSTKLPQWCNEGTEPSEELLQNGFAPGYKPPANLFNYFWNRVSRAVNELQSRTNVEVVYRDETGSGEANTLCFVIDEDKPDIPESPEEINAVAFDNVAFAEEAPIDGKTENYFEVSGGSEGAGVDTGKKIVMQNGKLTVLDEPDEDTVFLFDEEN